MTRPRLAFALAVALWPAAGLAAPVRVEVTAGDCARLVEHVPAPGVAYAPGVDVRGEPVVPAEVGGGVEAALPERLTVLIEVELLERLGLPGDGERYDGSVPVGVAEVAADGTVTFNGRPLVPAAQARLARRCQEIARGGG